MEDRDILNLVYTKLDENELGFTTKYDPTYKIATRYYELDEYGDLTPVGIKVLIKDVNSYIGDGAIDIEDAIDMWMDEAYEESRIGYKDYLKTQFKLKPVVDQIEVFEQPKLTEDLDKETKTESLFAGEDLLNNFSQYVANNAKELDNGLYKVEVPADLGYKSILTPEMLKKAYMKVKKLINLNNGDTEIVFENREIKTESKRSRLNEENTRSANLISDMFQAKGFDADSESGKVVIRTSELFNALSSAGYDVQVSFDNGESQNAILLGNQGGQVIITITETNKPLRAFASGNFEITDDILDILSDIQSQITAI